MSNTALQGVHSTQTVANQATASAMSESPTVGLSRPLAALLAAGAYGLPFLLSRSTSPTSDHPRIFLWYRLLSQPKFKPPDIAIPIAWTLIESGLAVAAYRLMRKPSTPARNTSLALLAGNVAAIGGWSRLFFGKRNLPASTVAAAAMIGTGVLYVSEAGKTDRVSAAAGVPFTAWVAFATVLTAAIWHRNR